MPGTKQKRGTGSWTLHVRAGTDFRGKPIRYTKTVHCKSEAAADRELALFYADCVNGRVNRSTPITVSELADQWYEEYVLRYLKVESRVLRQRSPVIPTVAGLFISVCCHFVVNLIFTVIAIEKTILYNKKKSGGKPALLRVCLSIIRQVFLFQEAHLPFP